MNAPEALLPLSTLKRKLSSAQLGSLPPLRPLRPLPKLVYARYEKRLRHCHRREFDYWTVKALSKYACSSGAVDGASSYLTSFHCPTSFEAGRAAVPPLCVMRVGLGFWEGVAGVGGWAVLWGRPCGTVRIGWLEMFDLRGYSLWCCGAERV